MQSRVDWLLEVFAKGLVLEPGKITENVLLFIKDPRCRWFCGMCKHILSVSRRELGTCGWRWRRWRGSQARTVEWVRDWRWHTSARPRPFRRSPQLTRWESPSRGNRVEEYPGQGHCEEAHSQHKLAPLFFELLFAHRFRLLCQWVAPLSQKVMQLC